MVVLFWFDELGWCFFSVSWWCCTKNLCNDNVITIHRSRIWCLYNCHNLNNNINSTLLSLNKLGSTQKWLCTILPPPIINLQKESHRGLKFCMRHNKTNTNQTQFNPAMLGWGVLFPLRCVNPTPTFCEPIIFLVLPSPSSRSSWAGWVGFIFI